MEYAAGTIYQLDDTNKFQSKLCTTNSFIANPNPSETIDFHIRHRCGVGQGVQFDHRHHYVCILLRMRSISSQSKGPVFRHCDETAPVIFLFLQIIDKADKMVPRFVQDVVGDISGMTGIFISCVFSASLSTVSAHLNTIAGVLYMDFIRPMNIVRHTDKNANRIMKLLVFVTGSLYVLGVWVIEKIPSCFQAIYMVEGMTIGSTFGVFSFGMMYPWANRHVSAKSIA